MSLKTSLSTLRPERRALLAGEFYNQEVLA